MVSRAARWPVQDSSPRLCHPLSHSCRNSSRQAPGRQAGEGSEIVGEMALIGKACLHGGLCRGDTPFQQAPCLADPHRHQIAVGRDALGLGKGPDQGGFAQSRLKAELLQRDMPGIVAPDERTGPLHLHPAGRNRFHHPGVPRQQEAPGQQQRLLPPELRLLPQHRPVQGPEAACQFSVPNHGHGKAGHCRLPMISSARASMVLRGIFSPR